jgi:hypothetical protein
MDSTVCDQLCCEYTATVVHMLSYYEVQTRISSKILNDIGRNSLLGNRKKIAKCLMRTFTCRSTFLYDDRQQIEERGGDEKKSTFFRGV